MAKPTLPSNLFTVYGRQPVQEALRDASLTPYKLHVADSNRPGGIMDEILELARHRGIPVAHHTRLALSRISRNGRQDQGVALDLQMANLARAESLIDRVRSQPLQLLALDGITNPQNVGMILRSVAAGGLDGAIIPGQGCARLDSLVIKASAGTFFRAPLFSCQTLAPLLSQLVAAGARLCLMDAAAPVSLFDQDGQPGASRVYVLGSETAGVSAAIRALPHETVSIPMARGVESLNVAMTATLIAYHSLLTAQLTP